MLEPKFTNQVCTAETLLRANIHPYSQEIPLYLWNANVIYGVSKIQIMASIMGHVNSVLPSTPWTSK